MDMSIEKSGEGDLEQKLSFGEDSLVGAVGGLVDKGEVKKSSSGGKLIFSEDRNGFVLLLYMVVMLPLAACSAAALSRSACWSGVIDLTCWIRCARFRRFTIKSTKREWTEASADHRC
jgi:hypothetical protein